MVRWTQHRRLLRDEERLALLKAHAAVAVDTAIAVAAGTVLEATGEAHVDVRTAVSSWPTAEHQRICDRAGIPAAPSSLHPLAFRDRHDWVHLPLDGAVRLAQAFAAAEPAAVHRHITAEEDEMLLRGEVPGERWWHDHLRRQSPGHALARRWAGAAQEADALRKEIARLRMLLAGAAHDLRVADQDGKARRLLRATDGR